MTDIRSSAGTAFPSTSSSRTPEVAEQFTIRVLGVPDERAVTAKPVKRMGRRLIAELSGPLKPEDCVEIDCSDALILGEVLGCWREDATTFAAIEMQQSIPKVVKHAPLGWIRREPVRKTA